jgi:FlaA1/EpsC-like NDP-sugar epimerase
MSDKLDQNGSEKKPFSGMLYQLKVSLFANKLTNWYFSKATLPYWCIMALDSIAIVVAGMIATYIAEGGELIASHFWNYLLTFICSLPLFVAGMRIFHTYSGIMRYSSFVDLLRISGALVVGFILNSILLMVVPDSIRCELTTEAIVVMLFISMIEMWTMRILVKYMYDSSFSAETKTPVFILGVRKGGISLAKSMRNDHPSQYVVKGFATSETDIKGRFLLGCEVYSYDEALIGIMHKMNVKTLFVSPLVTEKFLEKQDMIDKLTAEGVKIMMMPKAQSWDGKSNLRHQMMHEVDIEDLLPRDKIEVDMNAIGKLLSGRTILITGAAGSIGSEMVKQIAIYKPQRLILVDEAETPMHDVRLFMNKNYADIPCETIVTSITNAPRMERIFSEYHPDYVFHAAAYKHVPMMEDNPSEAVQNNIYGTRVIADMAVKYGTKKFVMISTDKAVNPTNVMGCSKRICEIYCQALNKAIVDGEVKGVTQFVTTRFGNVLGSNGSVIPIFKKQIAMGGPITVTHPDIIRFFMLIPEACKLVLEAGTMGKGGEIFVFDMGKPVRIADLAKRMIALSGVDGIDIKYVGLRDGEKLFEEVLNARRASFTS